MNARILKRMGLFCLPLAMLQSAGASGIVQPPLLQQATYALPADSLSTFSNEQTVAIAVPASSRKYTDAYIVEHNELLDQIKLQHNRSFQLIRNILLKEGVPAELVYMAVVESKMKNTATSYAGAAGIWQLMPATARTLGLRITAKEDQRRNIYKSTAAAAKYLNDLYNEFDDWLLVIAAYNCGTGNVHKAIKKAGSRDFWKLQQFLPKESSEHVKRFIAVHFYYEEKGSAVTMTKNERNTNNTSQTEATIPAAKKDEQAPVPPSPNAPLNWVLIILHDGEYQFVLRK